MIVESGKGDVPDRSRFGRMKLLQFSENHRPAYWGTWSKKTAVIRPRDPWAQDKVRPAWPPAPARAPVRCRWPR